MQYPAIATYLDELYQGDIRPGLVNMAKGFDCIDEVNLSPHHRETQILT